MLKNVKEIIKADYIETYGFHGEETVGRVYKLVTGYTYCLGLSATGAIGQGIIQSDDLKDYMDCDLRIMYTSKDNFVVTAYSETENEIIYEFNKTISEEAKRIYRLFTFDMRDADKSVESVENDIKNNPKKVISFLLDYIENN